MGFTVKPGFTLLSPSQTTGSGDGGCKPAVFSFGFQCRSQYLTLLEFLFIYLFIKLCTVHFVSNITLLYVFKFSLLRKTFVYQSLQLAHITWVCRYILYVYIIYFLVSNRAISCSASLIHPCISLTHLNSIGSYLLVFFNIHSVLNLDRSTPHTGLTHENILWTFPFIQWHVFLWHSKCAGFIF